MSDDRALYVTGSDVDIVFAALDCYITSPDTPPARKAAAYELLTVRWPSRMGSDGVPRWDDRRSDEWRTRGRIARAD